MARRGQANSFFLSDSMEDLDHIEVITTSTTSSRSDLYNQFGGSQNLLAGTGHNQLLNLVAGVGTSKDNRREKCEHGCKNVKQLSDEAIELISAIEGLYRVRTTSPLANQASSFSRGATPTNMVRRWSQSLARFDRDKSSMRERNFSPCQSEHNFYEVDGKLILASGMVSEDEVNVLAKEIEQHYDLMQDTALSHQHRLETLRALPQPLHMKRLLKQKLAISIEQQVRKKQRRNWCHIITNTIILAAFKYWRFVGTVTHSLEMWYDALKMIEGHFGCNVSSYFKFLRWMLMLNVLLFICVFSFIIFPQMLYDTLAPEDLNRTVLLVNRNRNESGSGLLLDLLTGGGRLQTSLLFYSGYSNATFRIHPTAQQYSLPHAYFMTMLMLYFLTFLVISTKMAQSYRISFIQAAGGTSGRLAAKTFCAWDYGIANRKAAGLKHIAIFTEFKEVLNEIAVPKKSVTIWWRIWMFCTRSIGHVLVTAIICGVGIGVWILLQALDSTDTITGWRALSAAAALSFAMLAMQSILSWISRMEDYRSLRRTLHISLLRNFLLEVTITSVLVYFLLTKEYLGCWETHIGQELYRFIVMDSFICILVMPLFCIVRAFLSNRFWPWLGSPEFDIPQQSVGLVYNQTLLWLGLLFAPLLIVVIIFKMLAKFYVNKAILLHLCKSPYNLWRSAQTQTLYLVFTFVSFLGVILALGYIMTQLRMSSQCGPFRESIYMIQIFIDGMLKLRQNERLWRLLTLLIRPAAVGIMLVIMAIMVYYLRAKSHARRLMVKMLKEMIYLEAKDKEFLLNRITSVTKKEELSVYVCEKERFGRKQQQIENSLPAEACVQSEIENHNGNVAVRSDGFILRSRNV